MTRQIVVDILGDSSKFNKATQDATTSAGKFNNVLKGIGMGIGMGAFRLIGDAASMAGQAITDFAVGSIQKASDFNETINKSTEIFGESAAEIRSWAKDAATSMGLSQTAAIDAAAGFGGLFANIGLAKGKVVDMSKEIVQLGADLGSFYNISQDDALQKLKAGLAGEAEPLRSLNVFISEAAVKAKAMAMGFHLVNGTLTEGQKVQARYALIMEQTSSAQGDFARTGDGLANSQKTLAAEMDNLQVEVGEKLLPVMRDLTIWVRDEGVPALQSLVDNADTAGQAIGVLAAIFSGGSTVVQGAADDARKAMEDAAKRMAESQKFLADRTRTQVDHQRNALDDLGDKSKDVGWSIERVNKHVIQSYQDIAAYMLGKYTTNFDKALGITEARADLHNAKTDVDRAEAYAKLQGYGAISEKDYKQWLAALERLAKGTKGKVHDAYVAAISDLRTLRGAAQQPINVKVNYVGKLPRGNVNQAFASGGTSSGGLAWVGEQGPEIVSLPAGSKVTSAQQSKKMAGAGIVINVAGSIIGPSGIDELTTMIARRIRIDGV